MAGKSTRSNDRPSSAIVWFRRDLRTGDNLALSRAVEHGGPVVALFVLEDEPANGVKGPRPFGAAARWWLHHSLTHLADGLRDLDIQLVLRKGKAAEIVPALVDETGADAVFWNRRYEPAADELDGFLQDTLQDSGIEVATFEGALLHEPNEVRTGKGGYYRVYTPFWRALEGLGEPRDPIGPPGKARAKAASVASDKLADWKLLPTAPDWSGGIRETWAPGEKAAQERLDDFIDGPFDQYDTGRDRPGKDETSRLSVSLAFGEITPYQIWHETKRRPKEVPSTDRITYRKEIAWREFSYHLLFHNADFGKSNFDTRFNDFPWQNNGKALKAWQAGRTGYPIVDAGMRQLWRIGWMHNRVRMIVASFLTKDLLIDWRKGEEWFWDTLVDADPASNTTQWQWVAGSGADAAPFFRIFNPILQGEKFDPQGDYVRTYVPELAKLPKKFIHKPFEAPESVLAEAGITLGEDYPAPIVDHKKARQRALDAFSAIKDAA